MYSSSLRNAIEPAGRIILTNAPRLVETIEETDRRCRKNDLRESFPNIREYRRKAKRELWNLRKHPTYERTRIDNEESAGIDEDDAASPSRCRSSAFIAECAATPSGTRGENASRRFSGRPARIKLN